MPERIQRKRTKGWKMPEGAVYVGRPTMWGNPFSIAKVDSCKVSPLLASQWRNDPHWHAVWPDEQHWCYQTKTEAAGRAVELYRYALNTFEPDPDFWQHIEGHDLACWCPLDQPCHADVLLELANHPCGHGERVRGCGGCDPGAVEFVRDDGGPWRKATEADILLELANPKETK